MSTSERRKPYPFDLIEPAWQRVWAERGTFRVPNPGDPGFDATRPKYYVLDMFPYPSGSGLHVGHPEGYTATDILGRYKTMRGFNVLHPMGWDAFGLPAEQHAIKTGEHPAINTQRNVDNFRAQLQRIGFGYDWAREVNTTDPGYFRWTQWIFLQIYGSWFNPDTQRAEPISTYTGDDPDSVRLAYVAEAPVNWCPELGTVLANEEVIDGKSEVGGHPVERRPMRQWMLRITAYAQRLIDELEGLDWPVGIKLLQQNWIGRSDGAEVKFLVLSAQSDGSLPLSTEYSSTEHFIPVFTTRPDTLYGATYMVLAPEHSLVEQIVTEDQWPDVRDYREKTARKSDLDRTELAKDKTGVWTGAFAINPVNGERIPIWIADYVLPGYGTGAIMAVPAHDERDWEFARKYALPIRAVVSETATLGLGGGTPCEAEPLECFIGEGFSIHSGPIDGLPTRMAKVEIIARLEELGVGKRTINYKLRDWLFSRQRYWGEPFPIVWEAGQHRAIPESELPLVPPDLADFKPTGTGEPPLAKATDWIKYSSSSSSSAGKEEDYEEEEEEGRGATRETNTMPQWAGSCWYYLRYCDPGNTGRFVGKEAERYWMTRPPVGGNAVTNRQTALSPTGGQAFHPVGGSPSPCLGASSPPVQPGGVDLYVGGTEHAVLHLLYARFWHKVLYDLGHVSTPEPFQRLVNQGLILGSDGQKMSKSRGNVVNPDDVIAEYGADALRCYEMFMGPLEATKPWSMTGVEGVARFLARVWRLVMEEDQAGDWIVSPAVQDVEPDRALLRVVHATVKKVGEDIETLSFNTAISQMMICTNALVGTNPRPLSTIRTLLLVLAPFAPHLAEELWMRLRGQSVIAGETWPEYDPEVLVVDEVEYPVQVNGKLRDKIIVSKNAPTAGIEAAVLALPKVAEHTAGKTIRKVIVVPGRLVNIVAN